VDGGSNCSHASEQAGKFADVMIYEVQDSVQLNAALYGWSYPRIITLVNPGQLALTAEYGWTASDNDICIQVSFCIGVC
jgi:hypothetical protein